MKTFRQILDEGKIKWQKADPGRRNTVPGTLTGVSGDIDEISITPTDDGDFELVIDGDFAGKFKTIKKAKDAATKKLNEMTVAGTGVGAYHPPLAMLKKFSGKNAMVQQFKQCTKTMGRKDMLAQCRRLGLSLSHLNDDDLRKTLNGMSVRNKRHFVGD